MNQQDFVTGFFQRLDSFLDEQFELALDGTAKAAVYTSHRELITFLTTQVDCDHEFSRAKQCWLGLLTGVQVHGFPQFNAINVGSPANEQFLSNEREKIGPVPFLETLQLPYIQMIEQLSSEL